jgi:P pilus assembly chaperone PapD
MDIMRASGGALDAMASDSNSSDPITFNPTSRIRNLFFFLAILLALFLVAPQQLSAQVSVQGLFYYFRPGESPVQNVVVQNVSERSLLVGVDISEIQSPGTENRKRVPAEDLLVSPRRFSLPAGTSRLARLLLKAPPGDVERVYRVSFVPESSDDPETDDNGKPRKVGMNIKVLTGMGILVFVEPSNRVRKLDAKVVNRQAVLTNEGNVNVYLDNVAVCPRQGKGECKKFPAKRLYAGQSIEFPLAADQQLTLMRRYGDEAELVTLDG